MGVGLRPGVQPPPPHPSLLGKAPVRLRHRLNLQRSALALISHFLPSSDEADQIKPRQLHRLSGGLVLCGEPRACPFLATVEAQQPQVSRASLGDRRTWPFKARSTKGGGHVGSSILISVPPALQASEPTELTQEGSRGKASFCRQTISVLAGLHGALNWGPLSLHPGIYPWQSWVSCWWWMEKVQKGRLSLPRGGG